MTPRLKLLSALLCLSIVYAVYDYIDRNNIGKGKELQKKAKQHVPGQLELRQTVQKSED